MAAQSHQGSGNHAHRLIRSCMMSDHADGAHVWIVLTSKLLTGAQKKALLPDD